MIARRVEVQQLGPGQIENCAMIGRRFGGDRLELIGDDKIAIWQADDRGRGFRVIVICGGFRIYVRLGLAQGRIPRRVECPEYDVGISAVAVSDRSPGHGKSAAGQCRDRRLVLIVGGVGIDLEFRTDRRAGLVEQLAVDTFTAAVLAVGLPDYDEFAFTLPGYRDSAHCMPPLRGGWNRIVLLYSSHAANPTLSSENHLIRVAARSEYRLRRIASSS